MGRVSSDLPAGGSPQSDGGYGSGGEYPRDSCMSASTDLVSRPRAVAGGDKSFFDHPVSDGLGLVQSMYV